MDFNSLDMKETVDVNPRDMKVVELRNALKERGLDSSGKKEELIQRLEEYLDNELVAAVNDLEDPNVSEANNHEDNGQDKESFTFTPSSAKEAQEQGKTETKAQAKSHTQTFQAPQTQKPLFEASHTKVQSTKPQLEEKSVETMTEKERVLYRASRFGTVTPSIESVRKVERAKRFGIEIDELKEEKTKQRKERFGIVDVCISLLRFFCFLFFLFVLTL